MQHFKHTKLINLLILLSFYFISSAFSEEIKTPVTLGWSGEEVSLGDMLQAEIPSVVTVSEFSCENTCKALLRLFRKVLSQSNLKLGKDINVISLGVGPHDTWELARQRALKAYERFPQSNDIERKWIFAVLDERGNSFLYRLGGGLVAKTKVEIPRVAIFSPRGVVTSIFTTEDLSTENFTKAVADSRSEHPFVWSQEGKEKCLGADSKIREDSVGIRIMRLGIIASLLLFFGIVLLFVKK